MKFTFAAKNALVLGIALVLPQIAFGQAWISSYDKALKSASENDWATAREFFKEATASRPEDQATASMLPGSVTEPKRWRSGAPYSPNFGAAYSAYRLAIDTADSAEKTRFYKMVSDETQSLISKGQAAPETVDLLKKSLTFLDDKEKLAAISASITTSTWIIDTSFVAPGDIVKRTTSAGGSTRISTNSKGGASSSQVSSDPNSPVIISIGASEIGNYRDLLPGGKVPTLSNKFALVIGNSETQITDYAVPFASTDAAKIKESLMNDGGYPEENITLLQNASSSQILESAKSISATLPADATVTIYFSGVAVSLDSKDYFAGTDTTFATDIAKMVSKSELYNLFLSKGAKIFAFYQTDRSMMDKSYFGQEKLPIGQISETHATIAGQKVYSIVKDLEVVGLYTGALTAVLKEFATNKIPLEEFCWQVFNRIRRGGTSQVGGGSFQTPTLPILTNMGSETAKF